MALSAQPMAQAVTQRAEGEPFDLEFARTLHHVHEDYQLTGAGQTVVVIDSGIAYDHPALGNGFGPQEHVVGGWDFTDENDADPYDDGPAGFHGTHVAGIIGSLDPSRIGLAPDADLIALRVFDDVGHSDFAWIERALQWVHDHRNDFENPITTVNLSIGLMPEKQLAAAEKILDDEFAQLVQDGIFISVAAGNGFDHDPVAGLSYPAASPWVVPVGSIDSQGQLSDFSRRHPRMLAAPGENINSTITDFLFDFDGVTDDWYAFSGTSQAAPFVAGAAVLVRQAMQRAGYERIDQTAIYHVLRETADWIQDEQGATPYARIDLLSAIESIVLDAPVPRSAVGGVDLGRDPVRDLGRIGFERLSNLRISRSGLWYELTTPSDGWLTLEARFGRRENVEMDLYDADGKWLTSSLGPAGYERIDWDTAAGRRFRVHLHGEIATGQLTVANLVGGSSPGVSWLEVPEAVSVVDVHHDTQLALDLDGLVYRFPAEASSTLEIRVRPDDRVRIRTDEASAKVYARPGQVDIAGAAGDLRLVGARWVELQAAVEQGAQLRLYGTSGDDRFLSRPGSSTLSGQDYQVSAAGFARVYAFAGGGLDRAELQGSAADEVFVARTDYARLSSASQLNYVEGFERVYAYAGGGLDRAFLYGSARDDSFAGTPTSARLASGNQLSYAEAFDRVYATAGDGGVDRAYLHDSPGADHFAGTPRESTLSGSDYLQRVTDFDRVYAYATPGQGDRAQLEGSPEDDVLRAQGMELALGGIGYHYGTFGFDQVDARGGQGGWDEARLEGSRGNDRLDLIGQAVRLVTPSQRWWVDAFSLVEADAGLGGVDYVVAPESAAYNATTHEYVFGRSRLKTHAFAWLFIDERPSPSRVRIPNSGRP